jgi:hypothetical protein
MKGNITSGIDGAWILLVVTILVPQHRVTAPLHNSLIGVDQ